LRLVPVIPHSLTNFALGLTGVRLGAYVLGSFLGQLPLTIAYADLGAAGGRALLCGAGWPPAGLVAAGKRVSAPAPAPGLPPGLAPPRSGGAAARRVRAFGIGPPVAQSSNSTVCTTGSGASPVSCVMQPILPAATTSARVNAILASLRSRKAEASSCCKRL